MPERKLKVKTLRRMRAALDRFTPMDGLGKVMIDGKPHIVKSVKMVEPGDRNSIGNRLRRAERTEIALRNAKRTINAIWQVLYWEFEDGKVKVNKVDQPLPTTTQRGTQNQLTAVNMIHMNHGDKQWSDVRDPLRTVVSNNHERLISAYIQRFHGFKNPDEVRAAGMDEPLPVQTTENRFAQVMAFLIKYYGTANGQDINAPLDTATSRARFGLVMVKGEPYQIVDIGMRMLTPRELARAQGFPDSYILTGTKTSQTAKIGNSVPPPVVEALVRANMCQEEAAVMAS